MRLRWARRRHGVFLSGGLRQGDDEDGVSRCTTLSWGGDNFRGWLALWLPTLQSHVPQHEALVDNVCSSSTAATFYATAVLFFLNYRNWPRERKNWLPLAVLGGVIVAMWAWLYLPLPEWVGMPLGWNRIKPSRMRFATGLGMLVMAAHAVRVMGLRFTFLRWSLFATLLVGGAWFYKGPAGIPLQAAWLDYVIIVPMLALLGVAYRWPHLNMRGGLMATCCVAAVLAFGNFNPLQSALPIFEPLRTDVTAVLDDIAEADPEHLIRDGGPFDGGMLNGRGYNSVAHFLNVPRLERFRELYPDLSPEESNFLFNRVATYLSSPDAAKPYQFNEIGVVLPVGEAICAAGGRQVRMLQTHATGGGSESQVHRVSIAGDTLLIHGEVPWQSFEAPQTLLVSAAQPLHDMQVETRASTAHAVAHRDAAYLCAQYVIRARLATLPTDTGALNIRVVVEQRS